MVSGDYGDGADCHGDGTDNDDCDIVEMFLANRPTFCPIALLLLMTVILSRWSHPPPKFEKFSHVKSFLIRNSVKF